MKHFLALFLSLSSLMLSAQTMENLFELTVAQDGSGNFKTIQEAINNVRDHAEIRVTIAIKPGIYNEKVVIPFFKRNITLKGLDKEKTVISYNDYSGKPFRGIDITGNTKYSTYTSYTLLVQGNDCSVENLTIENTAGKVGQAVALHTEGDRVVVKNCSILGNQDTLYLAKGGTRNYFENCYINGTTDFIFGAATVYFYNCTIESLTNSYVTAASTTQQDAYGFVFVDCKLTAKDDTVNKVFLARPWRPYAQTVFINTEMGAHILPEGWNPWKGDKNFPDKEKTVFYAEYASKGAGGQDISKRVSWSHQLKKSDLKKYDLLKVLNGWNPKN
ncbi:pectinesterase [Flavobacterium fluvii]|uniref:Pectinesterase n=1 Tax=Flavobacterium fluvii TaxID=468056 RepID=A0A1M5E6Q4_9FLAO|nr:pectinesterase family protein [Flavobacterium fluvii]SHF74731.1 pectinesterase [Flavobacterium fluvii]